MRLTWRANMNDRALGRRLLLAPYRSKMTHKALNSLANVFPPIHSPAICIVACRSSWATRWCFLRVGESAFR